MGSLTSLSNLIKLASQLIVSQTLGRMKMKMTFRIMTSILGPMPVRRTSISWIML